MQQKGNIVIVDDNKSVLDSLTLFLKNKVQSVTTFRSPGQLISHISQNNTDVVLLDMNFTTGINNGNEGIFWLREIKRVKPEVVVIMLTAYGEVELAVTAMKEGATDFILKPWENAKLLTVLHNALKLSDKKTEIKNTRAATIEKTELLPFESASRLMKEIYTVIDKIAPTEVSVLITGENGTGKELIARRIHELSKRRNKKLVAVDMGSISESLFESEIFGHARGAFTDAVDERKGRFEEAKGGTLFMDEIGNIPLSSQAKLLRALETKTIIPVGSNKPVTVDARIISAINNNPELLVKRFLFREDLLYRINTIRIQLPSLRERKSDIVPLANHFLDYFALLYDKKGLQLKPSAMDSLLKYTWPGNVRELKHCIEKAAILSDTGCIEAKDLGLTKRSDLPYNPEPTLNLEEAEIGIIRAALAKHKWNISKTAAELNLGRQTLYHKIKKYGL